MAINSKRRSQLVIPFGVGSIVDFKDETWMAAGLNFWPSEMNPLHKGEIENATQITDKRLQDRLTLLLRRTDNPINFFLQPTIKSNSRGAPIAEKYDMPFVRFPRWHFCEKCKRMHKVGLTDRYIKKCDETLQNGRKCGGVLTPIRFLIACEAGHISDFPWMKWVHHNKDVEDFGSCKLYFKTTSRPGLDGIVISCANCSTSRSMAGSMGSSNLLIDVMPNGLCEGEKPWLLNEEENDLCNEVPVTVQRGASNTYFANSVSSILVPPYSKRVRQLIDNPVLARRIRDIFHDSKLAEIDGISHFDEVKIKARLSDIKAVTPTLEMVPDDVLYETCKIKVHEETQEVSSDITSELEFRRKEFEAFLGVRPDQIDRVDFDILEQKLNDYEPWVKQFCESIVLVTSLRETRVLTGFSRIKPSASAAERVSISKVDKTPPWLPALEVRGEGIFIKFDKSSLTDWSSNLSDDLRNRVLVRQNWLETTIGNDDPNFTRAEFITAEQIMIHTFSHLLIRQLIYSSGYDSSSIRERLYVSDNPLDEMFGLLIYTASGDAEGTLGGLVSQGQAGNFEKIIKGALNMHICSNDPICHETKRQGVNGLNGAACHSCALLPETSCEHSNTLLDRAFLFGDTLDQEAGFFSRILKFI